MIVIKKGNIFNTDCQVIVNTVNCIGVMGKGLALEMKKRYPEMFKQYQNHCKNKLINIGKLWIYKPSKGQWILNFPTKYDWRNDSKIEYLEKGLDKFIKTYKDKGITSIAFPLLGASNGHLAKETSFNVMKSYLEKCDILIEIWFYE